MLGNNELRLNKATMIKAVQHYLESEVLDTSVEIQVVDVTFLSTENTFSVRLTSPSESVNAAGG